MRRITKPIFLNSEYSKAPDKMSFPLLSFVNRVFGLRLNTLLLAEYEEEVISFLCIKHLVKNVEDEGIVVLIIGLLRQNLD